jgi:hypothetical protein
MKKLFSALLIVSALSVHGHIEFEGEPAPPTREEIGRNRACFEDLSRQGCGDPGDDVQQFRSCLHTVFPSLSAHCQKLMSNLYAR